MAQIDDDALLHQARRRRGPTAEQRQIEVGMRQRRDEGRPDLPAGTLRWINDVRGMIGMKQTEVLDIDGNRGSFGAGKKFVQRSDVVNLRMCRDGDVRLVEQVLGGPLQTGYTEAGIDEQGTLAAACLPDAGLHRVPGMRLPDVVPDESELEPLLSNL